MALTMKIEEFAKALRKVKTEVLTAELSRRGYFQRGSGPKRSCECGTCAKCKNRIKAAKRRERERQGAAA